MSFITDPTGSIYLPKANWRERPSVRTVQQWISAEDLNQVRSGMLDLREAVITASTLPVAADEIAIGTGLAVTGSGVTIISGVFSTVTASTAVLGQYDQLQINDAFTRFYETNVEVYGGGHIEIFGVDNSASGELRLGHDANHVASVGADAERQKLWLWGYTGVISDGELEVSGSAVITGALTASAVSLSQYAKIVTPTDGYPMTITSDDNDAWFAVRGYVTGVEGVKIQSTREDYSDIQLRTTNYANLYFTHPSGTTELMVNSPEEKHFHITSNMPSGTVFDRRSAGGHNVTISGSLSVTGALTASAVSAAIYHGEPVNALSATVYSGIGVMTLSRLTASTEISAAAYYGLPEAHGGLVLDPGFAETGPLNDPSGSLLSGTWTVMSASGRLEEVEMHNMSASISQGRLYTQISGTYWIHAAISLEAIGNPQTWNAHLAIFITGTQSGKWSQAMDFTRDYSTVYGVDAMVKLNPGDYVDVQLRPSHDVATFVTHHFQFLMHRV